MTPITIVARIVRVVTGNATATLLHAVVEDGLEAKLEVLPAQARAVVPGQVLVMQWSVHSIPELSTPQAPARPAALPVDPLDHEFDIRSETPASTTGARDIIDEFNTLLGSPRRKG
jgi:hypothetical protein